MDNKGFLLVLMQPPPAFEEEFNAWYDTEHLAERLAVPGFETALRYVCVDGTPRYLAMYDMASPAVLDSAAYLNVSFDKLSPWSKRVTSRVRIYRSGGRQVYPGNTLTGRAARAVLLRFSGLPRSAESAIVAGVREAFESQPETMQVRVFANDNGSAFDYLAMVEAHAPFRAPLATHHFGPHRHALDMVNEYARYL
jgi:hypothetical protein